MNDEELTRLAEEEILRETKRAAERAAVYGALGWMKCPLRPTNKQFLVNTILPTLSTNKNRRYEARRNYYRSDDETYSRGFSPDDRYHSSDRHSHRARRESDSEGRSSHSHRDGKSSRERHDKHKDSSPRKRKHSDSSNFDTNKKESENSYSTEKKMADSRNTVDEHKESVHTSHKSHKVDKHIHRKSESSRHHKKHDDPISADQQYKDNEQKDHKTEVEERQTKGRFDVTDKIEHSVDHKTDIEERHTKGRFDVTDKIEHSVGVGLENCKAEKQVENSIVCDSTSKSKHGEVVIKQEETKDVQSNDTEHEKVRYIKRESSVAKKVIVSENDSNCKKGKHKKKIFGKRGDGKEDIKKRKKSRKRKKDKSKKDEGMHSSETKRIKKKRRALTEDSESIEAMVREGSMGSIAKVIKTENKTESIRYDKRSDEEKKWNAEDKLKVQQQYGNADSGRLSREEVARLEDRKYICQKSEANQDVNNDSRTKENDICRNFNAKAEKLSKNIAKSSATEEANKNCSIDNDSVCQFKKKSIKNKQTLSESKDSSYTTSDKLKAATACDKNPTCSKKDNGRNCCASEKYKSKKRHHKHSRSLKDTTNSPVHHRGKSDCLRDITDELYQDTKNSKQSKRKRWSIERD